MDQEDDARDRAQAQQDDLVARRAQDEVAGLSALDTMLKEFHAICVERRIPMVPAQDYEVEADPGYSTARGVPKHNPRWVFHRYRRPAGWPVFESPGEGHRPEMIMLADGALAVPRMSSTTEARRRTREQVRKVIEDVGRRRAKAHKGLKEVRVTVFDYVPTSFSVYYEEGYHFGVVAGSNGRLFLVPSRPSTDGSGTASPAQLYVSREVDRQEYADDADHPGGMELSAYLGKQLSKLLAGA